MNGGYVMKRKLDAFQTFLKEQLEFVDPTDSISRVNPTSEQAKDDLFHILSDRACLNADAEDVRIAFRALLEEKRRFTP